MDSTGFKRSQRVNVRLRDSEWECLERALVICYQRPAEFVRQAALERAARVIEKANSVAT